MSKRKLRLHFRIPPYVTPRNAWRRLIYDAARREARVQRVSYKPGDRLAVSVVLYLGASSIRFHDVDNRLKDVLDALQGRMGGPKNLRRQPPLVPNDSQVFRVTVTKSLPPSQSHDLGHATVARCSKA